MSNEPPQKRRRGNHNRAKHWNQNKHQPRDESSSAPAKQNKPKRYVIDHQLTQEELWDDSALIEAWDAAIEEYKSLNGPAKTWKEEPVHKSALWYAPPPKPQENGEDEADEEDEGEEEEEEEEGEIGVEDNHAGGNENPETDSTPINFNTFVPSHDPTLGASVKVTAAAPALEPFVPSALSTSAPNLATLTQDEIFERALSASYWAGYWAAMYHARGAAQSTEQAETEAISQVEAEEAEADEMLHVEEAGNLSNTIRPQNPLSEEDREAYDAFWDH